MLVLASTSPWRIGMLRSAGVVAEGAAPPVDEYSILAPTPVEMAVARAVGKARSVAELRPDDWVIGADQVCWMEAPGAPPGTPALLFEKPRSPEEHLQQLKTLAGREHTLSVAVALCLPGGPGHARSAPEERVILTHSRIRMRDLPEAELAAYVRSGEGAGCAGGYQAEAGGALLIERIDGDWYNVLGMPLFELISLLRHEGWSSPLAQ